ncbi:hypothetical protein ABPG72_021624 [Tetrahymena utriculariae]
MLIGIFIILSFLLHLINAQQCSLLNEHNMYCHQNPIIGYQRSQKYNYYITYEQQGIIIAWDYNQNYPLKQQDINIKNIKYAKITDSDDSFMVYSSDGIISFFNLWDFSFKNSTQIPNQNQLSLIYLESIGYLAHLNVLNYQLTLLSTWKQQEVEQIILDLHNLLSSNNKVLIFDSMRQQQKPAFIISTGEIYLIDLKAQSFSLLTKIIFQKGEKIQDTKQVNSKLLFLLSSLGNVYFYNIEQSQNTIQLNSGSNQNQVIQQIKLSYLDDNQNTVYLIGKTQVFYFDIKSPTQIIPLDTFNNQNKDKIKQIDIYQEQVVFINEENEIFLFINNMLKKKNNFSYSQKNKIHFTSADTLNYALYFDNPSMGLIIFDNSDSIHQIYQCYNTTQAEKDVYGVTIPTLTQQYLFQYGPYLNFDNKNQLLLKYYQNTLSLYNFITKSFLYVNQYQNLVNIQINNFDIVFAALLSQNTVLSFEYFTGQIITQYKFMCSIKEMIPLSTSPSAIVTNSFQKYTDSSCENQVAMIDLSTQNYQQLDGMLTEIKSQTLLRIGISEQQNVVINGANVKRDILVAGTNASILIYICQWIPSQTGSNNQYSCSFSQIINFNGVYEALQIEYDMNYNLSFVLFKDQKSISVFSLNSTSGNLIKQSQYEFQIYSFTIIQQSTGLIFFTQSPRSEIFSTYNTYTQFYSQIIKNKDFDNFPMIYPLNNNYKKATQFYCFAQLDKCLRESLIVESDGMFTSSNSVFAVTLFGSLSPQKDEDSITELYSSLFQNVLFFSQRSNKLNIIFDSNIYVKALKYNIPSNFMKIIEFDNSHVLALTQENLEISISYNQNRNIFTLRYSPDFTIKGFSIQQFNAFIFDEELQTISKDYQNSWIVGSSSKSAQQIAYLENFQIQINSGFTFDGNLMKVMKFNNFILVITYSSDQSSQSTQVQILQIIIDNKTQQTSLQKVASLQNLLLAINVIYDTMTQRIYFYGTSSKKLSNYIYYILYQDIQLVIKGQLDQSNLQYYQISSDIIQLIKLNIVNLLIYQYVDDERNIYQLNDQESSSVLIIVTTREIITLAQKLDPTSPQIYRILNYFNSQYQILKANLSIPLKSLIIFPSLQRTLEIRSIIIQNQAINLISKNNLFYQNIFFVDEEQHSRFILCGNASCQYFKLEKIKKVTDQQYQTEEQQHAQDGSDSEGDNISNLDLPLGSISQLSKLAQQTQKDIITIGPNYQIVQILTYTQQTTLTDVQNIAIYSQFIEIVVSYQYINIKDYETGKLVNQILINSYAVDLIYNKYLNNLHILNQDSLMFIDISEMITQSSQTITESITPNFSIIKCFHKMNQTITSLSDRNFYYLIGGQNGLILKQEFEKDTFQIEFSLGSEILGGFTFKGYKYFYSFGALLKISQTENNQNTYQKFLNFNNQGYKVLKQKQDNNDVAVNEYLIGVSYPQTLKVYSIQNGDIIQLKELKLQSNILNICQDNQTYEQQLFIADNLGNLYIIYLDSQQAVQLSYTSILTNQSTFIQQIIYDSQFKLVSVYDSQNLISFFSLQSDFTLSKITKFSYQQNQFNRKIFYDYQNHILIYRSNQQPVFVAVKIESQDSQQIVSKIQMVNFSRETPELKINKLSDNTQYLIIIQQNFVQVHEYYKVQDGKIQFPMIVSVQNSLHILSQAQIIEQKLSDQLLLVLTYENSIQIYKFSKTLSNFIHSNDYIRDNSPQIIFYKEFSNPILLAFYLELSSITNKNRQIQDIENLIIHGYSQSSFFILDLMLESQIQKNKQCSIDIYQTSYLSLSNIFNMYQACLSSIVNSASTKYLVTIYLQYSNQLCIIPQFPDFQNYSFVIKSVDNNKEYDIQNPPQINLLLTNKLVESISKLNNVKFQQLLIQINQSETELISFQNNLKYIEFSQCFWQFLAQNTDQIQNFLFNPKPFFYTQQSEFTFNNIQFLVNFCNVTNIIFSKNVFFKSQIQQHLLSVQGKDTLLQIQDNKFYNNTIMGFNIFNVRENVKVVMTNFDFQYNQIIVKDIDLINNQLSPIFLFLGVFSFNSTNLAIKNNNLTLEKCLELKQDNAFPSFIYTIQCFACQTVNLNLTNFINNQNILFYQQKLNYQIYNQEQDIIVNIKTDLAKFNSIVMNLINNKISIYFSTIIDQEYVGYINLEYSAVIIQTSLFIENQYLNKFTPAQLSLYAKKMFSVLTVYQSYSILIENSEFLRNQMINGGALFIEACSTKLAINNNRFIENYAQINGGAILFINYINTIDFSLTLNTIIRNSAQISGGAIHLDSTSINMRDNYILNNTAQIAGGGIRYLNIVPNFIKEQNEFYFRNLEFANIEYGKDRYNNTIQNNKAKIFGNNIASYSKYISLLYNYTILDASQQIKYKITQIQSGQSIPGLTIFLHDEEGNSIDLSDVSEQDLIRAQVDEVVNEIINSKASAIIAQNSTNILELDEVTEFSYSKKSYNFSSMQVIGIPGNNQSSFLQIQDIPIYSSYSEGDKQFIKISSSLVQIELDFRECQIGEIKTDSTKSSLYKCTICPKGKYQLKDPKILSPSEQVCLPCPLEKASQCFANQIQIKQGYWRKNNETDEIIQCKVNSQFCNGDSSTNYCSEGRIGPLCETCDIFGEVWKESYFHSSLKTCSKCHSFDIHAYINVFLIILIFIYIIIVVRGIILKAESQIYSTYLRKTGLFIFGTSAEADKSTMYIKMLITYLFISTSFFSFNLLFPLEIINLTTSLSNPIKISYFSVDCLIKSLRQSSPLPYARIIILQLAPLIFFGLITIFFYLVQKFKKQKFHKKYLFASISTIFILFHGSISQSLFELISCRTIGSDKYVQIYLTRQCYDSDHILYSISLGLPLIIIWVFVIPILLFFYMRSQKSKLDSLQNLYRFGSITQEYKKKTYYWEIVRIYLRVIISFFISFFLSNSMFKGISVLIIILIYWIMVNKYQPYTQKSLNKTDKNICMVEMIIVMSCTFIDNTTFETLKIIFSLIVYILHAYQTIYLIYNIIYSYYHKNVTKLIQVIHKIISKINCFFCKELRESIKYSSQVHKYSRFKHWQFLRLNVHQAILLRKGNPKHKMLSAQTVRISQVNHVRKIRSQLNCILSNQDNSRSYVNQDPQIQNVDDMKIKKMQSILHDKQGLGLNSPQNKDQNQKEFLQKVPLQSQFSKLNQPLRNITDISSSNISNNNNGLNNKSCFVQDSQFVLDNNTYRIYQTKQVNNYYPQTITSFLATAFPTVRPLNDNNTKSQIYESNNSHLNFSFTENQEQGQSTPIRLPTGYIQTAGNLQTNANLNFSNKILEDQIFITEEGIEGKANPSQIQQGIDQIISNKKNIMIKNKEKQE